jgi:quercetin dioxygenase-like cupin family protein
VVTIAGRVSSPSAGRHRLRGSRRAAVADLDLRGEGALGPAEQGGQHLAGLVGMSSSIACLPRITSCGCSLLHHRLQDLGDGQRLDHAVGLDQDAAVGAHGQRGADRSLRLGRADRDHDDLGRLAGFLQAQRFLDRDLVEGVHRHLDVGGSTPVPSGLHADLHVVIDNPFHGDQELHRNNMIMGIYSLRPGETHLLHYHESAAEYYYILTGTGAFTLGDRVIRGEPGLTLYMPAKVNHAITNDGDEDLSMIFCFDRGDLKDAKCIWV